MFHVRCDRNHKKKKPDGSDVSRNRDFTFKVEVGATEYDFNLYAFFFFFLEFCIYSYLTSSFKV